MEENRTKKAARNILTGFAGKILLMALAFAARTIFVRLLGAEYNGINGLYSNILSILALSELGVGNVMAYALYKALKEDDKNKICSLVYSFKKIYHAIAFAVLTIGVALVPFLDFFVKDTTLSHSDLVIYYLLYLLNSVISYFVANKTTLIIADQKNYIVNICDVGSTCTMYVLQILYLLISKDFFGYLIIQAICTVGKNIAFSAFANKMYPYLQTQYISAQNDDSKKELIANVKSTFIYKLSIVIINNTDNLLISVIVGTIYVGYYANYSMLVTNIIAFVNIFISGIMASLGNLNAENDKRASYKVFRMLSLIFSFTATITTCCFWNCTQNFMKIWLGESSVQPMLVLFAIVVNNYFTQITNSVWMFRETMGLFKEVRWLMLSTAGLNIILSVIMGKIMGMSGILLATLLAKLLTHFWYEPLILYKQKFGQSCKTYFTDQFKQAIACVFAVIISMFLCRFIGESLIEIIVKAVISALVAIICIFTFNCKSEAWRELIKQYISPHLGHLAKGSSNE